MRRFFSVVSVVVVAAVSGLASRVLRDPSVVVTTAMLESAVRAVVGSKDEPAVVLLIPPGSCPGHFDLGPRTLPLLKSAALIVRHDFQKALGERISTLCDGSAEAVVVETKGSLLIPDNYADLVRRIAAILSERFPDDRARFERSVEGMMKRMQTLSASVRKRTGPLQAKPVVAAVHQKEFCRWLGLEVVGVLRRPEDVTPAELAKLKASGAAAVVGNLQSGADAAKALAQRMDRPVVMLSNFPGAPGCGESYEELLSTNIQRLERALGGK